MLQHFSLELAQAYYNSTEQFPVDFDHAWKWLEYSRKDNAKRHFERCGFLEGTDFEVFLICEENLKGGRPSENIKLSTECFKQWGMMTGTEKGQEIRRHFLRCEQALKELLKKMLQAQSEPRQIEPLKQEHQLEALKMLFTMNERSPDDRTTVTLKAHLTNLVECSQVNQVTPQLLSVTEVCEMHGIHLPKGKDSVVGRKVASLWRSLHENQGPQICAKHVGSGHRTADIKVYPTEFFERIIAIASEYLN